MTVLRESSASSGRQIYYAPRCDFSGRCHVLALEEASRRQRGTERGTLTAESKEGETGGLATLVRNGYFPDSPFHSA